MLFFRKKHGFKGKNKIFRRLFLRFSRFAPLVIAFSVGMFGTNIYYKNKPTNVSSNHGSDTMKIEAVTNQLNNEKDITDSLSSKNIELKKKLKEALSKANDKDSDLKVNNLNAELSKEKLVNKKLTDESSRLKLRINNILAKVEASKNNNSDARTTQGNRNTAQSTEGIIKDKNYNKVKMELAEDSQSESKQSSETNRNNAQKAVEVADTPKKVVKSKSKEKRTMKLKKGESLWNLSKRAYGKGIYYKRIIKANPSITEKSFKKLRPGTKVNVPL